MRPRVLHVEGFTAFRDRQSIDFTALDLFAIAGPTGSGKTSILDAMTYALFGEIDRIGKQAAQFVSQGQPRMSVMLEFEVGDDRYRVTRTARARGQTKILLERWTGAEWTQAGDGADRVRDVDARIRDAIGLDYDAFTRTVLLPQGKFAQFLVGDAKARRDILTELLGLDLFGRLARRAGELRREAQLEADTRTQLLEREYAGVTPDAVADAERAAKEAAAADATAAEAEQRVRALAEEWADTARSVADLRSAAADATSLATAASDAVDAIDAIGADLEEAEVSARAEAAAGAEAGKAAEVAEKAVAQARGAWGSGPDLGVLLGRAEGLSSAAERAAAVERELADATAALPAVERAADAARRVVATCTADVESAVIAFGDARDAEEVAAHADHVAAVRAGVKPGDDCPVCGAHVARLPKARGAPALEKARAARAKAEKAVRAAEAGLREATAGADEAERALAGARADIERIRRDGERARHEIDELEAALLPAFGGKRLPDDPAAELTARVDRLDELEEALREAIEATRAAGGRVADAERRVAEVRTQLAEVRGIVDGLPVTGAVERASALLGTGVTRPRRPAKKEAAAIASYARALADAMQALGRRLNEAADDRAAGEATVLERALGVVDGLVPPVATLDDLVGSVSAARTEAARAAATAEGRADEIRAKLEHAERLLEEASGHRSRATRFEVLSRELDARHIIPFLLSEALELLAAAGSRRLETLSDGRYRLEYADDEFSVVDTWNGEERRSARTLSGGETFLASLALALGLSEQVRALAVSDRARLEALFLDEGFGTLDPESLEVVVEAIEQLGGDGRMVGVITHVQELALRLPARVEVEKSPRGSTVRVVGEAGSLVGAGAS